VARERRYLAMVQAPPLEAVRQTVLNVIAHDDVMFVALVGDEVIGWIDIIPARMEGFRHNGRLGMGVLREYRRMGLGKRLARAAIDKAQTLGLERVELSVLASNTSAIRLYEKLGFEVEGVNRRARKLDGEYDDLVVMALFLPVIGGAAPGDYR
jgi:RimJ/RimL family protein N-acetyltransferase